MAIPSIRIPLINFNEPKNGPLAAVHKTDTGGPDLMFEFRVMDLDGESFIPCGIYNGTDGEITVTISQLLGYTFKVKAGSGVMYPASSSQDVTVSGYGNGSIVFVNYPIIQG